MITLHFTARQNTMRVNPTSERGGLLGFHKDEKEFRCDSSDLDCAGMNRIPKEFAVKVVESGNTKVFTHAFDKYSKGEDRELQYHLFKSTDGFTFMIFND